MSSTRAALSTGPGYWRSATVSLPVALVMQYILVVASSTVIDRVALAAIVATVIMFAAALALTRAASPAVRGCAPGILAAVFCFWVGA